MGCASNRKPMTQAQRELAVKYIPLAKSIAWRFRVDFPAYADDFLDVALLAVCEAAESFDPSKAASFATFARHRIWGAIRDLQRSMVPKGLGRVDCLRCDGPHEEPIVSSVNLDMEERGAVLNTTPDDPVGSELESAEEFDRLMRLLPRKETAALTALYCSGDANQSDVARALGCSKSRASYLIKSAHDQLRYQLKVAR